MPLWKACFRSYAYLITLKTLSARLGADRVNYRVHMKRLGLIICLSMFAVPQIAVGDLVDSLMKSGYQIVKERRTWLGRRVVTLANGFEVFFR